jgi:hypothetical protein
MVVRRKQRGVEVRRGESWRISSLLLRTKPNIEAQMEPIVLNSCEMFNITVFARSLCS